MAEEITKIDEGTIQKTSVELVEKATVLAYKELLLGRMAKEKADIDDAYKDALAEIEKELKLFK